MKKLRFSALIVIWYVSANIVALSLTLFLFARKESPKLITYSIFQTNPHVTGEVLGAVTGKDSRAEIIDQYFAKYKCPLTGTGVKMVEVADKYNFEFWWLAAIAWQESTCGKQMIPDSYNAWGYGIYGDTVTKFTSWEEAMDKIGSDLSKNFFGKGLIEPCEVEKRYTPPSKGRWCKSIQYFRDAMLYYKT
ncbi:MAG: hypothetical protein AAB443_02470 [Patescibacteria group bacterium]